ncbi:peptidoglycan D,D-transpeptidase FtsI family protein [Microbacterium sp. YY-01]|uniref:peptidoglycan D,D-transpeptidase FtsI family protein n=1 Tax=Microbacterium sp. YY-01 TaxID=3421634 RepID=UPI003D16B13D
MAITSEKSPRRRTTMALAVLLAVIAGFVFRLVDIQVVNADAHIEESHNLGQLGESREIAGARGSIVDTDGEVLAQGTVVYDAQLDPLTIFELEDDELRPPPMPWEEASAAIASVTGQKPEDVRRVVDDAREENPSSQYAELKKGLSTEQFLQLRELGLPYLALIPRSIRVYPNGAVAGNILGFLSSDGDALAGLEMKENECLAPENGRESFLRGQDGVVIPGSHQVKEAVDGGTLTLTIDLELQWYMQQMIAEEVATQNALSGTVFVVEVDSGKVRAAAEFPAVDPNDPGASDAGDRGSRLFTTTFEPGSTFKAITAAAIMEKGGATALSTVTAASHEMFPNGAEVNDAFPHPEYEYTLAGALIDSSNVALSKFGDMVSPQVRYDYLVKFGVGEETSLQFPGEEPGVIHPVDDWDSQSRYTTTFGQYYTVTVPQAVSAYQAIANDGVKLPLTLVESCTTAAGDEIVPESADPERVIKKKTAQELSRMIENVATQGGLADDIAIPGYRVAAKTGTAEKPDLVNGGYKGGVYFTSMLGYAPVDNPQYVVMVTLDEPTRVTSSAATAPAFHKAMTQVLKSFRVMPSSIPMEEPLPKYR